AALTVDTKRGKSGPGPKRETKAAASGKTRLWVSVGRKAGITPGDIVGAVTGESGLKGRDVGPVKVNEFFSLVDVPDAKARKVVKALNHCTIRGRKVKVKIDQA
ncbi:MAG: DbpA RNA binding domain-containing protein, partial [Candidatus Nanopelagicales bacterium]